MDKDEILMVLNRARKLHMDASCAHANALSDANEASVAAHQATVFLSHQIGHSYTPDLLRWSYQAKLFAERFPGTKNVANKHRKVARELIRINTMLRTDL
jgi:hypothetical protein